MEFVDIIKAGERKAAEERRLPPSPQGYRPDQEIKQARQKIADINSQLPDLLQLMIDHAYPTERLETPIYKGRFERVQKGSTHRAWGYTILSLKYSEAGQVSSRSYSDGTSMERTLFLQEDGKVAETLSRKYFSREYECRDLPPSFFVVANRYGDASPNTPLEQIPGLVSTAPQFAQFYEQEIVKLVAKVINS